MQVTTHTDYALRLLIYLALSDSHAPVTVQDAAERYNASTNHMAKVAQTLVRLGYVHSQRGRNGGLTLAKAAGEIDVGQLVRQTENLCLLECFGPHSTCPIDSVCRLRLLFGQAQKAFLATLDGHTVAEIAGNPEQLRANLHMD